MKLNVMFIIAAIYGLYAGLVGLLSPSFMGVAIASTPVFLIMTTRFWGVASLGLGVIAWLVRNAEPSKTRDAVVQGFTFFFALDALVSLYGQFVDPDPLSMHWLFVVIEGLIAVGFFMAYRSSRATNAS